MKGKKAVLNEDKKKTERTRLKNAYASINLADYFWKTECLWR